MMENSKVVLRNTPDRGMGVFAVERIDKGEVIAGWKKGTVYWARRASELPDPVKNHAVQFSEHIWIDCDGIARFTNHSCEPNCGIHEFQLVAMREIQAGEEITWDYDMTENCDWRMVCMCGTPSCRGVIRGHRFLPEPARQKYVGYAAQYLSIPPYPGRHDFDELNLNKTAAAVLGTLPPEPDKARHSRSGDRRLNDRRIAPRGTALPRGMTADRRATSVRRSIADRRVISDQRAVDRTAPAAFSAS